MSGETPRPPPPAPVPPPGDARIVNSEDLFGPDHELIIRHDNMNYRLRITRAGKLILTK